MTGAEGGGDREDRFEVREKLGVGGTGIVYRAFDRQADAEVALKVLKLGTARDLYRFKREFRALADIAHPNLVTLYELHTDADEWFLTMELVRGVSFIEWVRPGCARAPTYGSEPPSRSGRDDLTTPTTDMPTLPAARTTVAKNSSYRARVVQARLELARLEPALYQLCDIVHALHRIGKLHRDLKPSNVLVDDTGRVRLLDFGLVSDLASRDIERTHDASAVGTPNYMSPEQAADQELSPASDWYGVGVMLYEALSGWRPTDLGAVPGEPPPPLPGYEHAPMQLAELAMALLDPLPERRPTGDEVLRGLGREPSAASAELVLGMAPAPFVGRVAELARIDAAFARVRAGLGSAVFVRGPSGIGKSALVRRQLEVMNAAFPETIVLRGRCYERESVPYKTLDTIVDALGTLLMQWPAEDLRDLLPPDVPALARLFPALRRVPAVRDVAPTFQPLDPVELRRRAFSALRLLLTRLARRQPLIVALDDLQWGDADSGHFLAELLLHPDAPPLLLIIAHRSDDESLSGLLDALRGAREALEADSLASIQVATITLAPLSHEDSCALVQSLGADASDGVLAREAGGSPFFLSELARASGHTPGGKLDDVLLAHVARLPLEAQAILRLCAIAARPLPAAAVLRAAGVIDEGSLVRILAGERLLRVRRVESQAQYLETYHDRVRAAVVAGLSEPERRELHAKLASTLGRATEVDHEALVTHWMAAGVPGRAATHALFAANVAEERLAFHRAGELLALVLEHGTLTREERERTLRRSAHAMTHSGRLAEAADLFARSAEAASDANAKVDDRRLELEQRLRAGQVERGLSLASELLAGLGFQVPRSRGAAIAAMLRERFLLWMRGLEPSAAPTQPPAPEQIQRVETLFTLSTGMSFVNPVYGRALQTRFLREVLKLGILRQVGLAFSVELGYLGTLGGPASADAERLRARALAIGAQIGDRQVTGIAEASGGLVSYLNGRWREAFDRIDAAEGILRDHGVGVHWELDLVKFFITAAAWYLGDFRELLRRMTMYLREVDERGNVYARRGLLGGRANLSWLVLDRPEEARARALSVTPPPILAGQKAQLAHFYHAQTHALIDLYEGDGGAAHERIEAGAEQARSGMLMRIQSIRIESMSLRARALVAAAPQRPEQKAAVRQVRSLAAQLEREKVAWARPLASIARAGAARLEGDDGAERAALEAAARGADEAAMAGHARAVRWRLGCLIAGAEGAELAGRALTEQREAGAVAPERLSRIMLGWSEP